MNLKGMIGTCALAGLLACGGSGRPEDPKWMESGVSVELAELRKAHFSDVHYSLFFNIPEVREDPVVGNLDLSLRLDKPLPLILDFRGDPEQVRAVSVNGKDTPYELREEHIRIDPKWIREGENQISISFTSADQSLNRREEFLYTLLVPDRARTVFPCFDQPDMKSVFSLTLEIPSGWQAVANGKISRTDSSDVAGRKRIVFNDTEPLSTYLFSFVAGELKRESYSRDGREIAIYHRETDPKKVAQCPDIAAEVFDALAWQEDFTGVPYPFVKYDLIILPGFQYGGMEHTGATLYADRRMFLNDHPTLNERLGRSALIAHETSHMWFGDYVTMKWFDDVWTKEVFANYFASRIVEPLFSGVNHRLNVIRDYIPAAYAEDRTAGANPIKQELDNLRNAGLVYGNIVYDKSPVVMEMLARMLGEEAFRDGIREYVRTFAYGNATWDDLIGILDRYTDADLKAWSDVWVNQEGMPEIMAEMEGDELVVSQQDPLGRGLCWPQTLTYRVVNGERMEDVVVTLGEGMRQAKVRLPFDLAGDCVLLPNIDGRGYGFFKLNEKEASAVWSALRASDDAVLRGSLLITLYENLRRKVLSPERFRDEMLTYLPAERDALLFSMALGYMGDCQRLFPLDPLPLERALWQIVTTDADPQYRLLAFRLYRSIAVSDEATSRLLALWKERKAPKNCALGEADYVNLAYSLAIRLPERADEILATQLARIENPDRKREFEFIAPSVSPRKAERDSVFASLLIAENRRIEPWASAALANLNHPLREKESVAYIRPALEALPEVQRTGDIFFPTAWVRALLTGHTSKEAGKEVEAFFADHPDFPKMLSNKIRQQADHLR